MIKGEQKSEFITQKVNIITFSDAVANLVPKELNARAAEDCHELESWLPPSEKYIMCYN